MEVTNVTVSEFETTLLGDGDYHAKIDKLEAAMQKYEPIDCPLMHLFTPGLYIRTIFMPAGSWITSLIHKQTHPYTVLKGSSFVLLNSGEWERVEAPHVDITKEGTRRVLYVESDCVWTTTHRVPFVRGSENDLPEDEKAVFVERVEGFIYETRVNPILGVFIKNNRHIKLLQ